MEHPPPPPPQHWTPGALHGTPPAFMEHPPQHTPSALHGAPPALMDPPPLPHSTAHQVYYTVPHQPSWATPSPSPTAHTGCTTRYPTISFMEHPPPSLTALHTGGTTRYPTSLYGTPPPLPSQHCTRGYYTVPCQPFWNTPCTSPIALHTGALHSTPPAFMEHPPLPHSTTGGTTRCPTSLCRPLPSPGPTLRCPSNQPRPGVLYIRCPVLGLLCALPLLIEVICVCLGPGAGELGGGGG